MTTIVFVFHLVTLRSEEPADGSKRTMQLEEVGQGAGRNDRWTMRMTLDDLAMKWVRETKS